MKYSFYKIAGIRKRFQAVAGILFLLVGNGQKAHAQSQPIDHDTSYYISLADEIMTRFYFSKKYTSFRMGGAKDGENLAYKPNTTLNMGVGATYKALTLNLAFGFPFLNKNDEKGKTKYLDLQSHIYTRKWSYDLWGQLYKGYYLSSVSDIPQQQARYIRKDIGITLLGVSAYKIVQPEKYSYRAAFLQNELQLKSAGSWLLGGEVYYGRVSGDSALVPAAKKDNFNQSEVEKLRFFNIGPGVGYTYTYVLKKRFFISGSATGNLNIGVFKEKQDQLSTTRTNFNPNFIYRGTLGYNSYKWSLSVLYVGNRIAEKSYYEKGNYVISTGNYRAIIAYRLKPGKKLKEYIKPVEKVLQ